MAAFRCTGSQRQSLVFPRNRFTPTTARKWATAHGMRADKVDVKPNTLRLRQFDPAECCRSGGMIPLGRSGVQAYVCPRRVGGTDGLGEVLDSLDLLDVTEYGRRFATGVPVVFPFTRNTESARKYVKGGAWVGIDVGAKIEPAGRYMLHDGEPAHAPLPQWEKGVVGFRRPIVLRHGTTSSDPDGWKSRLSRAFGGKIGRALSRAIVKAGYDGIVTAELKYGGHTSEIVDLSWVTG